MGHWRRFVKIGARPIDAGHSAAYESFLYEGKS
jgi:hypothetical protein